VHLRKIQRKGKAKTTSECSRRHCEGKPFIEEEEETNEMTCKTKQVKTLDAPALRA
jgi:hypothetical protein